MSAPVNANTDSTANKQHLFCKSNNFNNIQLFSTPNDSKDDQKSHFTPPRLSNSKISKDCHVTESLSNKTILKNAPTDISKSSIAFSTDYFPPDWIDSSYSPAYVSIQQGLASPACLLNKNAGIIPMFLFFKMSCFTSINSNKIKRNFLLAKMSRKQIGKYILIQKRN